MILIIVGFAIFSRQIKYLWSQEDVEIFGWILGVSVSSLVFGGLIYLNTVVFNGDKIQLLTILLLICFIIPVLKL